MRCENSGMSLPSEVGQIFDSSDAGLIRIFESPFGDNEVTPDDVRILNSHYLTKRSPKNCPPCIMITTHLYYRADQRVSKRKQTHSYRDLGALTILVSAGRKVSPRASLWLSALFYCSFYSNLSGAGVRSISPLFSMQPVREDGLSRRSTFPTFQKTIETLEKVLKIHVCQKWTQFG